MESILVLTHADESGTALSKGSLEAVTAGGELAARLGAELTVGIVAKSATIAATQVAGAARRLLAVQGEAFGQARFASDATACEALCRAAQATIVVAPGSSRFARVMAAVAHRVGGAIDTHVAALATHITAVGGADGVEATRWFYRQRVEAVVSREKRPWFLLVDAGTHAAFSGGAVEAQVEQIAVELPAMRTHVTGMRAPQQGAQTIRPDAKLLFVAGAGWTKKQPDGQIHVEQAGELILKFLKGSGASLGSSKSLVDQGGEGQLRAAISDASQSSRANGFDAEACEGAFDLLPRRRAARGGLAIHRRAEGGVARSELRMDARQGGRGVRG